MCIRDSDVIVVTDCQAILKLYLLAESTNNTKLTRWLNILETIVENKIKLLWRSNKSPDIMCADYLSRYMENARHENILIKFSNKLPKLKEEDLQNNDTIIPEQYKISDRPITFKELKGIFREVKVNNCASNNADGASQGIKETPAEDGLCENTI